MRSRGSGHAGPLLEAPLKRAIAALLPFALLVSGLCLAQQAAPPAGTASPAGPPRILVPVLVTDSSGRAISGLKAEDFAVKRGRDELKAVGVEEVEGAPPPGAQAKSPVFVVLDKTTVVVPQLGIAKPMLLRFLADSVRSGDPIGLFSITHKGIVVTHQPGTTPPVLAAALERLDSDTKVLGGKFHSELAQNVAENEKPAVEAELARLKQFGEAEQPSTRDIDEAFVQVRGLQQLASGMRRMPGRKQLLFVTGGFLFTVFESEGRLTFLSVTDRAAVNRLGFGQLPQVEAQQEYTQEARALTVEYERAIEMLNEAKVTIYPALITSSAINTDPMLNTFSRATAGKFITFQNELGPAAKEVAADSGNYYLVACEAPPLKGNDTKWVKLDVEVKRPGAKVRHPEGYFAMPAARP